MPKGSTRFLAPALVPPGIDHQENENQETQEQQNYCPWLVLPELLETFGDLVKIHAEAYSTPIPAKTEVELHRPELRVAPVPQG